MLFWCEKLVLESEAHIWPLLVISEGKTIVSIEGWKIMTTYLKRKNVLSLICVYPEQLYCTVEKYFSIPLQMKNWGA